MNSNKILAILGLLLLLILAIGSVSASDMDSEVIGDSADIDSISEEVIIDEIDNSNIVEEETTGNIIANAYGNEDSISDDVDSMDNIKEDDVGVNSILGVNGLASTVTFTENKYSTYFNSNGNIIAGN